MIDVGNVRPSLLLQFFSVLIGYLRALLVCGEEADVVYLSPSLLGSPSVQSDSGEDVAKSRSLSYDHEGRYG